MLPYIDLGTLRIEPYGLLVLFGTAAGLIWLWSKRAFILEPQDTTAAFWQLAYSVLITGFIVAKLGFILVEWAWFRERPGLVLFDWRSGWVFWFGILGSMLGGRFYQLWYNRLPGKRPRAYLPVADYIMTCTALGFVFGRLGCFTQGCCHGLPSGLPWAVRFTHPASNIPESLAGIPLHPTQLYEAGGQLLIFAILTLYILPGIREKRFRYGTAFFAYLAFYSTMRFLIEFIRGDERGILVSDWLSPSQWISLIVLGVAIAILAKRGVLETAPLKRSLYLD